jgi:hypothetical protein|tara:strand:+ start:10179 stop:10778 length:600 start_codon:yes stop_codon:yes gene_type:complete
METFNTDPKPGRLILPLVLIGMIATTYTFVQNATEVTIEEPVPTTVEAIVVEESIVEDTTTTTTIPENVLAYLEEINSEKIQADELGRNVLETNQRWEDKDTTYQEAQDEFNTNIDSASQFLLTVTDPGPPEEQDALKSSHQELVTIANNLYQDTEDLLEGLTAPDTGELRSAALESFNTNIELFKQKVEEIINSVSSG